LNSTQFLLIVKDATFFIYFIDIGITSPSTLENMLQ